jgi:hypothetical protein
METTPDYLQQFEALEKEISLSNTHSKLMFTIDNKFVDFIRSKTTKEVYRVVLISRVYNSEVGILPNNYFTLFNCSTGAQFGKFITISETMKIDKFDHIITIKSAQQ